MADYYTQASFMIRVVDDEQKDWLVSTFEGACKIQAGDGDSADHLPEEVIATATDHGYDFDCADVPDWSVEDGNIWVHSDESIDIEFMIVVIQAYLKRFHPNSFMGFEWSNVCSKPRLDAFGGGAVYIDAKSVEFTNTGRWLCGEFAVASKGGGEHLT